ncbi:MAG: hypothetical protein ACRD10_02055, partial [Terriglobia bacterium]
MDELLRYGAKMAREQALSAAAIAEYLQSRPRWLRWREWASGHRRLLTRFGDRSRPLLVVAHSVRDARVARQLSLAAEQDWVEAPHSCREAYDEILTKGSG